jgi:hypothetical protein
MLFDPIEQDIVRIKSAEIIGEIGRPQAIEPMRNKKFGNGLLSRKVEESVEKIHERYATRECPFCAEIITKGAKVCKHCGEMLLPLDKILSKGKIFDPPN